MTDEKNDNNFMEKAENILNRIKEAKNDESILRKQLDATKKEFDATKTELESACTELDNYKVEVAKEYVLRTELEARYVPLETIARYYVPISELVDSNHPDYVPRTMYVDAMNERNTAEEKATTAQRALEEANTGFMQYKIKLNDMLDLIEKALDEGDNND
ncbi:MAG: hypothetical protein ABIG89_00235 [Candidatus Woesearchaeota archaeon]